MIDKSQIDIQPMNDFRQPVLHKCNVVRSCGKVLEIFAGSRSFGNEAEKAGMQVFSLDIKNFEKIDLVKSIMELERKDIPFVPDIIWASPVCSAWSKTGWFHFWNTEIYASSRKFVAKKDYANESVEMVRKTIEIFSWFPNAIFFMENPEGMLYRHPVINNFVKYGLSQNLKRKLVTYCSYGDTIRKPTHIWTNSKSWLPKKPCQNGDPCHESSPRCTMNGIYKKKGNFERSKVPAALCEEILNSCVLSAVA